MRITEIAMRPGMFAGTLSPTVPKAVRRGLSEAASERDGHIVVFDTRTRIPSFDRARYVGHITDRAGDTGFIGHGWPGVLQADNDLGKHIFTDIEGTAQTLSQWVDNALPYGGVTKGFINTTGLTTSSGQWTRGLGAREFIDAVCAQAGGAHWRITPGGSWYAATAANLYPTTPTVIVTDAHDSQFNSGLRGVKGNLSGFVESGREITSRVLAFGAGRGDNILTAVSMVSTQAYDINNAPVRIDRIVNLPDTNDFAVVSATVNRAKAQYQTSARVFDVQIDAGGHIERQLLPGDPIYVHDQQIGVTGTEIVMANGVPIRPLKVWSSEITWQSHEGQGVWLHRRGFWKDLTPWVEHGDGSAMMRVSTDIEGAIPTGTPNRLDPIENRLVAESATIARNRQLYVDKNPRPDRLSNYELNRTKQNRQRYMDKRS